ncbi:MULTISPECIES: GerMN domain-containing protein [Clostridium]|jgi:Sporulation and spore germination|uniref:GerMN domain-containing protein n=1 Tax=Clostridium sartagoforme AAU1 TaxID=1202534 RepID=R9CDX5_9CLOT|nr:MULTISPECIES: GerMN domain-containing protein [Clostridium]EOR27468.1 hypothetical protein A500_04221 [Clostridium sartagoforme AAU1]KLE16487.1 hypothetical protein AAT22_06545 [Clostridium sp. C8]
MNKKFTAIIISLLIGFSMISCQNGDKDNNISEKNNTGSFSNNNDDSKNNINNSNNESSEIVSDDARIYYYDVVIDKIVYINKTIEIKDKATATALINELKKSPNSDISPAISNDISLISAKVNDENDTITLNFSSNFVEAQNLGSGAETNTLKAICNTFGDYFNVSNVIINLDDKPYTSGHILMKDGDSFKVDTNNSIELK